MEKIKKLVDDIIDVRLEVCKELDAKKLGQDESDLGKKAHSEVELVKEIAVKMKDDEVLYENIFTQLELRGYNLIQSRIFFYSNDYEEYFDITERLDTATVPTFIEEKTGRKTAMLKVVFSKKLIKW